MSSGSRGPRVTHPRIIGFINLRPSFETALLWALQLHDLISSEPQLFICHAGKLPATGGYCER